MPSGNTDINCTVIFYLGKTIRVIITTYYSPSKGKRKSGLDVIIGCDGVNRT